MRPGSLAPGRSRKCSLAGRIRERVRRFLSVAVSVSVIACSMPAIPAMAATDNDNVQEFTLTVNDLCDAVEEALQEDEPIAESAYVFEGEAQETYEDLFYGADVYEIKPEYEKDGHNDLSLKIFVRLGDDRELDSTEITGEEEIVFLLMNSSKEEATARIMIDEYETGLITVAPKSDIAVEGTDEEATGISTLSASGSGNAAEGGNDEAAGEDEKETEDTDESEDAEAGEAEADKAEDEAADDEDSAGAEEPDNSAAEGSEGNDQKDSDPEKAEKNEAGDKGRSHESARESGSGDRKTEKSGTDDKAGRNESGDKGERGFEGGSHDKSDKSDGNDSGVSSDKAEGSNSGSSADSSNSKDDHDKTGRGTSKDTGEKSGSSDSKDSREETGSRGSSSAESAKSSHRGNTLRASLEDDGDDSYDDEEEIIIDADGDEIEIIIDNDEDETITADDYEGDNEDEIVIDADDIEAVIDDEIIIDADDEEAEVVINEDDEEIISDSDAGAEEPAIELYAAQAEADDDDITEDTEVEIASASDAKSEVKGYTLIEGETYEPVVVNHSRSGVAYVTTLQQLGIDYGIMPLAVSTAGEFKHAVENAAKGDEVVLEKDITVDYSDSTYITVNNPGITVDLGGNTITVTGTSGDYSLFDVACGGEFTLQNGTIDGTGSGSEASAVTPVCSETASNDVTLDELTIQNFGSASNGAVYAKAGNLTVKNCKIQDNATHGIHANGCQDVTITDCIISNNSTTSYGGGIYIFNEHNNICIEHNTISQNQAIDGGGIYIEESGDAASAGSFKIIENVITGNEATGNGEYNRNGYPLGNGGGIYFEAPSAAASGDVDDYDLSGNTITKNKAAGYGGGIELSVDVEGREVVIKSGLIADNSAYWGGGIDSSFSFCQSVLHLYNAVITDNVALARGGGLWACPTSETTMNETFGAAIYGNTASGRASAWTYGLSGDEIRFEGYDTDCADTTGANGYAHVSERALGGALVDWYADDDNRGNRYQEGDKPVDVTSPRYNGYVASFGLHGELSDEGIALSEEDALLYIVDNYSETVGGGIATNTAIDFGATDEYTSLTVTANKIWIDENGNPMTAEQTADYSVDITLVRIDEYRNEEKDEETVTLNAADDWTWDFKDLPTAYMSADYNDETGEYTYTEHPYTYTVKEVGVVADSAFIVKVESSEVTDTEDGSLEQTVTVTNTKAEGLVIGKQVQGSRTISDNFTFKITLTNPDGTPYDGDIDVTCYSMDSEGNITDEDTGKLTFTNGEAEVTLAANGYINLKVADGMKWTAEELTENDNCETYVSLNGTTSKAKAASGTVADSTQVLFINSFREYFDIDEEIIPNMDDAEHRETWEKNESVTEYGALEFEMSTYLPIIVPDDVKYGDFTMYFHNKLDEGLRLDANEDEDIKITIGGKEVDPDYYTVDISEDADIWTIAPLALVDGKDECTFHVTVDLTRLYNETDIVNDEGLLSGNTEIIIYFYVDLEGQSMDGSYKSVVQYQIFDEDELLYTSSESTVYVYTYEIGINKSSSTNGRALAGATFGVYYDETCTQPVMRYGESYTVVSGEDGKVLFYGLAAGTYYLKELEAPEGYILTTEIFKVVVGEEKVDISGSTSLSDKQLDGAVFEVYYDEDCTQPVRVDGVHYTVTSNSDGAITFDGIAAGNYYLKGVVDSEGNDISSEIIGVTLDYDTFTYGYEFTVGNDPSGSTGSSGGGHHSSGGGGGGGSTGGSGSTVGGPGDGGSGGGDSDGSYYPLEPLPQTGDPGAAGSLLMMLFGIGALLVIAVFDRKKSSLK